MALVCTVELDKVGGIKVTLVDPDGDMVQRVEMDATSIVLSMSKGGVTSTFTQTEAKVLIECKQFEVAAEETITMSSKKATSFGSLDTMSLEATKALTVTSDESVKVSAPDIKAVGDTSVALENGGNKVSLESAGVTVSSAAKLALEGGAQVDVKGPMVGVKAEGILKLESSGMTTLKGGITNVQGSMVNVG